MNPSYLRRVVALAAVAAGAPVVSAMFGDTSEPGPLRATAHASRYGVTLSTPGATPATAGEDPSEHWHTIELPPPGRLGSPHAGGGRNFKVRT